MIWCCHRVGNAAVLKPCFSGLLAPFWRTSNSVDTHVQPLLGDMRFPRDRVQETTHRECFDSRESTMERAHRLTAIVSVSMTVTCQESGTFDITHPNPNDAQGDVTRCHAVGTRKDAITLRLPGFARISGGSDIPHITSVPPLLVHQPMPLGVRPGSPRTRRLRPSSWNAAARSFAEPTTTE